MGFDIGRVGIGVATGGMSEYARLAQQGLRALGQGGSGGDPYVMETPEQKAMRAKLAAFAETGRFGDFQAGAEVPLGYGDYRMTDLEGMGQSGLADLMRSGVPEQYKLGDAALQDLLATSPGAIESQFQPFKDQTDRMMRESDTAMRRNAGFSGNLYSTDTIRKIGDVQARGNESKMAELARLTNQSLDRRLQAIPLAYQSAQDQEQNALGRVAAASAYGGLTRQLNDASIKSRDAELLRRRQELQLPIQAAQSVAGMQSQWGTTPVQQSPYEELLGMVGQIGGQYLGNYAGSYGAARGKAAGSKA